MSEANGKKRAVLIGIGAVVVAVVAWAGFQAGPAGEDAAGTMGLHTLRDAERYRAGQSGGSDGEAGNRDKSGQGSTEEERERSSRPGP